MSMTALQCSDISKRFGDTVALDGFHLDVQRGGLLALLGPSGCGKTTALRVIAGFERPDSGSVWVDGEPVAGDQTWVPPEHRRVGMVFQDWALFPHLDVWSNVAFGLKRNEDERVRAVLKLVDLTGLEHRMPHELSGGQQQRVALARALAPGPRVILLDEPFSSLDAGLRASVRAEVREVLREAGATAVFVTHDQEEALSMADRLAVMVRGRVLQMGAPHEVYRAPANREVGALVGESNFIPAVSAGGVIHSPLGRLRATGVSDGPLEILARPESIALERDDQGPAVIEHAEFYGHDQLVRASLRDGTKLAVRLLGPRPDLSVGARARLALTAPVLIFRDALPLAVAERESSLLPT